MSEQPTPLWQPSESFKNQSRLRHYMDWLSENRGLSFEAYADLWAAQTSESGTGEGPAML